MQIFEDTFLTTCAINYRLVAHEEILGSWKYIQSVFVEPPTESQRKQFEAMARKSFDEIRRKRGKFLYRTYDDFRYWLSVKWDAFYYTKIWLPFHDIESGKFLGLQKILGKNC